MKKRILCLLCAIFLLVVSFGTFSVSADSFEDYAISTDPYDLSLYYDGVKLSSPGHGTITNTVNPEYGDIGYLSYLSISAKTFTLKLEREISYFIPAGARVCLEFLILGRTELWGGSSTYKASLGGDNVSQSYILNSQDTYSDGYSGISDLIPLDSFLVKRVVFYIDNSFSSEALFFNKISFDFICNSKISVYPQMGMSGVYVRFLDSGVIGAISNQTNKTGNWFTQLGDRISGFFSGLGDSIFNTVNSLAGYLSVHFSNVGDWFTNLRDSIGGFFTNLWTNISDGFSSVGTWFTDLGDRISGFFSNVISSISGFFTSLTQQLSGWFGSVGTWFTNLGDSIGGFFTTLINHVTGFFVSVGDFFKSAATVIEDFFNDMAELFSTLYAVWYFIISLFFSFPPTIVVIFYSVFTITILYLVLGRQT